MALTKHKSATVSDVKRKSANRDRRVVRTRKQLDAAFVDLLHRRSYGNIRVSDITRKSGVGRATFYAHYASKDDLLMSQFSRIVAPMLAAKPHDACPLDAVAFFAHVTTAPRTYKALMGPEAGKAPRILRECIEQRVQQSLGAGSLYPDGGNADIRKVIAARFVATSLLAVIECSIEGNGGESPENLQLIFSKLVGGGLSRFGDAKSDSNQKAF
jgi:AcrR family transcriptional regulator